MIREVKLGEICNILNGYAFKSKEYVEDGIRIIRITNVQKGIIQDTDPKYYDITKIEILKNYMLKENDLLISLTGNVGRVGQISKDLLPAGLNQRVGCIRIKEEKDVSIDYLYQYFNSYNFERDCINNSKGIAQKNLSTEWLKNYKMKIPNLDEQKRIAIELRHIQRIKDLKQQQLKELDQLIKSQFVEMFDNKNYPKIRLKEVLVQDPNVEKVENTKLERFITVGINGKGARERIIKDEKWPVPFVGYRVKGGQFIYSRIDARNGAFAIIPNYLNNAVVSKDFPIFDIDYNKIKSDILLFSLLEESFIDIIKNSSFGATNRQRIKEGTFLNYKIYLPPITIQNEFSEIVKQIDKQKFESMIQLDKENRIVLKNIIKDTLEETNSIYEFLFKKYFEKGK